MKRSLTMTTAAALTGLALFVTACTNSGTADGGGGGKDGKGGGGSDADNAVKTRQCLREHGIDAPDPGPGQNPNGMTVGGGADPQKMEEAMKACGMRTPGSGEGPTQEQKDKELRWVRCMRENGVYLKDPEYSGGMKSGIEVPKGQEKAFEEAQKKCEAA
ncbi:hypothetical protein [Streptomyces sp. C]|uniref:hypothetical protein n=1 Tax=Streptomyces sp. C TaxID=253839 RepID=UPI0005B3253B|nr:hypothetical protein [Streptomyces sp. C]